MRPSLETAELPADAIEVGRIADAWGVKGWFKVIPHSASPEALFSCRRWHLLPPERAARPVRATETAGTEAWTQPLLLKIRDIKAHADTLVASSDVVADRNAAEGLKGARIFVPRSSFPTPGEGEYYWVDLIGLDVLNREGIELGRVTGLIETGAHCVLRIQADAAAERLIPFVAAYIDAVDLPARLVRVDWGADF